MKNPAWIKSFVVFLVLLVGLLPVLLYLWTFGRVPVLDVDRAMKMLNDPAQNAILVDVRPENEYLSMHIAGSHPWPAAEIISLHSLEQIPAEFKGESLLLICNSGVQSAQAADKLISLGAGNVYTIKGGLQKWIAASDPNLSSPAAKIIYASAEGSLYQPMTSFEQMSAVVSGFGIKPLHMLLSAVLGFILLRQKAADLRILGGAVVIFLSAEIFCAINYLFYDHTAYLAEYLHSYGMALSFGLAAFAIMQGMDGRLINFSAPDKRCALLPLCRGCVKYDQRSCKVRTLFQWAILALAILAFIPLAASPAMNSYVTTIFGTPYNYCRLLFNQYFESRYLPLVTLFLCAAAMVVMRLDGKKQMPILARILFAGAAGALGFGIFRLMLGAIFSDALIWADFWEEVTELMFVGFMAVGLWVYREGVLDVPLSKGLFR